MNKTALAAAQADMKAAGLDKTPAAASDPMSAEEANKLRQLGLAVIETEAKAVSALAARIDANFVRACEYMLHCEGRIVVLGMGKSGHIGGKIAATMASTGSPAFFVHPGEASHGDLGMITPTDVVLALSNSGETGEIITILPIIKRLGVPLITLTGNPASALAQAASVNIDVGVEKEACPLDLAPTASTTSLAVIMPRSPWLASPGWTKNAGVPVLARVAAILLPICPDLPMPMTTTRPSHLSM